MKKLALLLFGISLYKDRKHWAYHTKVYSIDWRLSYDNYQKYIIDFFRSKGFDIDIYLVSNTLEEADKQELLEKWKPKAYDFLDVNNDYTCRCRQRNEKIIRVIELCKKSLIQYDNILITRFDLKFKLPFDKLPLDYSMFNSAFYMTKMEMCDNFLFMDSKSLEVFYNATCDNMELMGHRLKLIIEKQQPINYLFNVEDNTLKKSRYNYLYKNTLFDMIKLNNYTKNQILWKVVNN